MTSMFLTCFTLHSRCRGNIIKQKVILFVSLCASQCYGDKWLSLVVCIKEAHRDKRRHFCHSHHHLRNLPHLSDLGTTLSAWCLGSIQDNFLHSCHNLPYITCCSFYIQVEQELWHTLCASITLTWKSQCVNYSQLWTLPIIFVHLQKIAPIKEMFLMLRAISFSLACVRLICTYCAVYFPIGQKKKWAWYSQMCSSVCLQVFHFVVSEAIHTLPTESLLV